MKLQPTVSHRKFNPDLELAGCSNANSTLGHFANGCREMLRRLKQTINLEMTSRFGGTVNVELIRQAINEADAIAASLPFPSLILPTLAEEKVLEVLKWQAKQRSISNRSLALAA